jgi:serine protease inhibitor
LVPDFVTICQEYLDATAREIDFQAPGAADTINSWVAENTNQKITEMIKEPISPDLALLLLNAIYFNASWTYPFDSSNVRTQPFYLADGTIKDCELMRRDLDEDQTWFKDYWQRPIVYFRDGDYFTPGTVRGARLPYGSEGFYMTLLMPDTTKTMEYLMELMTPEKWSAWQELPAEYDWWFSMPKFRFGYNLSMTDILSDMGLDIAFDPGRADFSKMFSDGVGWIDYVEHDALIQVDEYGTEAAATTNVYYQDSIPPNFRADRPFLVIIHEESTGVILFIGRISDPVWET